MWVALLSGTLSGFALFAVRQWTVVPMLAAAEAEETKTSESHPGMLHNDEGWQPSSHAERNGLTALATVLSCIGFAASLFGVAALSRKPVTVGRGALWGLGGFACFVLAPSLGLPPELPGAAVAALNARQLWWAGTVAATAAGLWLLLADWEQKWLARIAGVACLVLPHVIGAPVASGPSFVPANLAREFFIASVATNALFWLLLGTVGGFLYSRTVRIANEQESH